MGNMLSSGVDKMIGVVLPGWDAPEDGGYSTLDAVKDSMPDTLLPSTSTQKEPIKLKSNTAKRYMTLPEHVQNDLFFKACNDGNCKLLQTYLETREFNKELKETGKNVARKGKHQDIIDMLNGEMEIIDTKYDGYDGCGGDKCIIL